MLFPFCSIYIASLIRPFVYTVFIGAFLLGGGGGGEAGMHVYLECINLADYIEHLHAHCTCGI